MPEEEIRCMCVWRGGEEGVEAFKYVGDVMRACVWLSTVDTCIVSETCVELFTGNRYVHAGRPLRLSLSLIPCLGDMVWGNILARNSHPNDACLLWLVMFYIGARLRPLILIEKPISKVL